MSVIFSAVQVYLAELSLIETVNYLKYALNIYNLFIYIYIYSQCTIEQLLLWLRPKANAIYFREDTVHLAHLLAI